MAKTETYPAAPARIGNSRGFRVDASLFQAHPELRDGSFEAAYIGPGMVLVRQRQTVSRPGRPGASDVDPIVAAYLAWTERVMADQPHHLRQLTQREFELAEALVEGIEVDIEHDRLPEDFELP